jgi:hypothetical protein
MSARRALEILTLAFLLSLGACATYVPPTPASPQAFSRDLNAPYGRTWSAVTFVAGENFFRIKAFEKASGLMTVDFDLKNVTPYVDCGTAVNKTTSQVTPALLALGLSEVSLSGTANIDIRSEGPDRTAIQFNSQYTLDGYRTGPYGGLVGVAQWQFTSGSSDTQNVPPPGLPELGTLVTCRPSYKIERDFLSEVSARL